MRIWLLVACTFCFLFIYFIYCIKLRIFQCITEDWCVMLTRNSNIVHMWAVTISLLCCIPSTQSTDDRWVGWEWKHLKWNYETLHWPRFSCSAVQCTNHYTMGAHTANDLLMHLVTSVSVHLSHLALLFDILTWKLYFYYPVVSSI